jgi:hypothetical protein
LQPKSLHDFNFLWATLARSLYVLWTRRGAIGTAPTGCRFCDCRPSGKVVAALPRPVASLKMLWPRAASGAIQRSQSMTGIESRSRAPR